MGEKASNNNWRFERKFALNLEEFISFEKQLMIADLSVLYPKRTINNCYLDSTLSNSYAESIEGFAKKMKIRVRWYGNLMGIHNPRLEFKIKQNNSNKKEIFALFETDINRDTNWYEYVEKMRKYLKESEKFYLSEDLEPVLINSYDRYYYSNSEETFRLTIDENLTFLSPQGATKNKMPYTIEKYIIELKFDNANLLSDFPLAQNLGKFSKFTTGLSLIN